MPTQWTNDDFDKMGWHDCHVHGLRLGELNEQYGACELELDIDYIIEWLPKSDSFQFRVAPATLTFHRASQLRLLLDYTGSGMTPFSLTGIEREPLAHKGQIHGYHWRLVLNWPKGEITFDASALTQTLRREPVLHEAQYFSPAQRAGC